MQARSITADVLAAAGCGTGDEAPAAAVEQALAGVGEEAGLVLFFSSNVDPTAAAEQAAGAAGSTPLAGMTGNGVIASGTAIEHGASAIAFAPGARVGIGLSRGAGRALNRAARHAATEALRSAGPGLEMTLLLFLDTRSGDQAEAIAGAYAAAGPGVPLVGGGAGGPEPAQIVGPSAHRDSVVAVAIGTEHAPGVGHAHGCRPRGAPAIATRSEGRYLYELDGRPAVDVYLERLGYGGVELGREEFLALAVTHPLAQPELHGTSRLRHVLDRGPGGSLECATHIPANAAVDFTHQTPQDIVDSSGRAVEIALSGMRTPPRAAVVFDCAGRKRAVADSLALEVDGIRSAFGAEPPPMAGLFSHGEVFRRRGAKGDRNHAVVVAAFA